MRDKMRNCSSGIRGETQMQARKWRRKVDERYIYIYCMYM